MIARPTTGGDSDGDDGGGGDDGRAFFGARLASPRTMSASPIALRLFW